LTQNEAGSRLRNWTRFRRNGHQGDCFLTGNGPGSQLGQSWGVVVSHACLGSIRTPRTAITLTSKENRNNDETVSTRLAEEMATYEC